MYGKFNSIICTKDGNSDHNNIKKIFKNQKKLKLVSMVQILKIINQE